MNDRAAPERGDDRARNKRGRKLVCNKLKIRRLKSPVLTHSAAQPRLQAGRQQSTDQTAPHHRARGPPQESLYGLGERPVLLLVAGGGGADVARGSYGHR